MPASRRARRSSPCTRRTTTTANSPTRGGAPTRVVCRLFVARRLARVVHGWSVREVVRLPHRRSCPRRFAQGDHGDAARPRPLRRQPTHECAPVPGAAADRPAVGRHLRGTGLLRGIRRIRSDDQLERPRIGRIPHRRHLGSPSDRQAHRDLPDVRPSGAAAEQLPTGRGAITIIDANRNSDAEPADRFHIDANQLNGGIPASSSISAAATGARGPTS